MIGASRAEPARPIGAAESASPFEGWPNERRAPKLRSASVQLAGKCTTMTADQLRRKLRNFPAAKLTRLAALA